MKPLVQTFYCGRLRCRCEEVEMLKREKTLKSELFATPKSFHFMHVAHNSAVRPKFFLELVTYKSYAFITVSYFMSQFWEVPKLGDKHN